MISNRKGGVLVFLYCAPLKAHKNIKETKQKKKTLNVWSKLAVCSVWKIFSRFVWSVIVLYVNSPPLHYGDHQASPTGSCTLCFYAPFPVPLHIQTALWCQKAEIKYDTHIAASFLHLKKGLYLLVLCCKLFFHSPAGTWLNGLAKKCFLLQNGVWYHIQRQKSSKSRGSTLC